MTPATMDPKMASAKAQEDTASSNNEAQVGSIFIDPVKEKKLLRKLDICICPLVMLIFLVAYLDRSNIGYAILHRYEDQG